MHRTATGLFGDRFTWSAAGVGYPAEFQLAAASLIMGGHVRVGLEDNLRVDARPPRGVERRAGGEGAHARPAARPRARDGRRGA